MIQTTIRIPKELHQKLKAEAKKRGMTANGLIANILWEYLQGSRTDVQDTGIRVEEV